MEICNVCGLEKALPLGDKVKFVKKLAKLQIDFTLGSLKSLQGAVASGNETLVKKIISELTTHNKKFLSELFKELDNLMK